MNQTATQPIAANLVSPRTREAMLAAYDAVRGFSEHLCTPLKTEDYVIQSMTDASPAKWHLAHVTWFFEEFVLATFAPEHSTISKWYRYLFNSYYESVGPRQPRPRRGMLTRPTVEEVYAYRAHVDAAVRRVLERADEPTLERLRPLLTLGLHHEQQHQELLLTDLKHGLAQNPMEPAYQPLEHSPGAPSATQPLRWVEFEAGLFEFGHADEGFAYDNESPRHKRYVDAFALASRPVTCGEFIEFIDDGGYDRHELWLSDGWARVREEAREAPLYWRRDAGGWSQFTLHGRRPVRPEEPLTHISYYEADAFAHWAGARLPTEFEWERAAAAQPIDGHFAEDAPRHPRPADPAAVPATRPFTQLFGTLWEWTRSDYAPYPGFRAAAGAIGEYNGKFMCSQYVLRGGSCATPRAHIRPTYRNFFYPDARWQFSGVRLAKDPT